MNSLITLGAFGLGTGEIAILLFLFLIILLLPNILFLVTLQSALNQVSPQNRTTSPGTVWLMFIPLFNLIWQFLLVGHIANSLQAEFRQRNIPVKEFRPGYGAGLWMCITALLCFIPVLNFLSSLAFLILWIVYWSKIAAYKNQLKYSGHWSQFAQTHNPAGHTQNPQNWQNPPPPPHGYR